MKRQLFVVAGLIIGLWLTACGSTEPPPNLEETVSAAVAATLAVMPSEPPAEPCAP